MEELKLLGYIKEFYFNKHGLEYHGYEWKKHIIDWIEDD